MCIVCPFLYPNFASNSAFPWIFAPNCPIPSRIPFKVGNNSKVVFYWSSPPYSSNLLLKLRELAQENNSRVLPMAPPKMGYFGGWPGGVWLLEEFLGEFEKVEKPELTDDSLKRRAYFVQPNRVLTCPPRWLTVSAYQLGKMCVGQAGANPLKNWKGLKA